MRLRTLALLGATFCAVGPAYAAKPAPAKKAAPKTAPVKKPAAKPAPAKAPAPGGGPVVLGTKQLPGDFGQFGTTYTIGKEKPINFTLRTAEYRPDRFVVGETVWGTTADQKMLVLRYTLHNPTKDEIPIYWATLNFTAVDAQDVNHAFVQAVARDGDPKRTSLDASLKPAQKIDVITAIEVPADGVVPKLIVQREEGAAVVRYDLRGKVKGIAAPFANTEDSTGASALQRVPAQAGVAYPLATFDVTLTGTAFTSTPLNGEEPSEGRRYFTATFTIKNATNTERPYYWATLAATLKDADGESVEHNQILLKASRDEAADGTLEPGDEARVRLFFAVPADLGVKSLGIRESESRTLVFDVSNTQ